MNVTCDQCGWVHFAVTRVQAQEAIDNFNAYFAKLSARDKRMYGNREVSMKDYECCFICGAGATFHPSQPDDCPDGCTIQPTVYEGESHEDVPT